MNWLAERIEHWPIERLIPYVRNARTHSPEQVAMIAGSIAEFGFTNPCLVGSDGVLIAGHGRLLAAMQLGLKVVPVLVLDHLTPTQRRALVIADNRIAEQAGWDNEVLRLELEALEADGFDLSLVGFDADDLAELVEADEPDKEGQTDDDAVPEAQAATVSQRGDVWLLGQHRLVCGDSTTAEAYAQLLGSTRADMVFTDPPYNVDYANTTKEQIRGKARPILNDALGDDFPKFLYDALVLLIAHCKGGMYIAMSTSEIHTLCIAFREAGGHWSDFVVWVKNHFTMGGSDYQRQYEPLLYGWPKDAKRHWCGDRDQSNVWHCKRPVKNDLHPTMKPVELIERAIRNSSKPGQLVLDAFGGSGSTLIAAEKTGRVARLIELDPKYSDVIVRRWQDWTGKQATREEDGVAFDEAACDADAEVLQP